MGNPTFVVVTVVTSHLKKGCPFKGLQPGGVKQLGFFHHFPYDRICLAFKAFVKVLSLFKIFKDVLGKQHRLEVSKEFFE